MIQAAIATISAFFYGGTVRSLLPPGYDPTAIRSGPPSRASSRQKGPRYNVCGCGYRTRLAWRLHQHDRAGACNRVLADWKRPRP